MGVAREIPLRRRDGSVRAFAVADDEDYEGLSRHRWYLQDDGYVERSVKRAGRSELRVAMHRQLMGFPVANVDHRDGDPLNNRRSNLRVATKSENGQNRVGLNSNNRSGVRGVHFRRDTGKWAAEAKVNRRKHCLGSYDTIEEATAVVVAFRAKHMPFSADARAA